MTSLNNDIEKYLRGELTPAERHALEQKALDDPFLAEALEGAEHAGAEHFGVDLKIIKKSLHKKTKSRRRFIDINGWQWYSGIAAGLLLFALITYTVIMMIGQQRRANEIAALEEKISIDTITSQQSEKTKDVGKSTEATSGTEQSEKKSEQQKLALKKQEKAETARRKEAIAMNDRAKSRNAIGSGTLPDSAGTPTQKPASPDTLRTASVTESVTDVAESPVLESREEIVRRDTDDELAKEADARKSAALSGRGERKKSKALSETVQPSAADLSTKLASETLIRGKVSGEGQEIPGVNVIIKGTSIGTVTNEAGEYMIAVPAGYSTLSFAFIGLVSTEVPVAAAADGTLNVEMSSDVTQLSEVVVTGYGVSNSDQTYPTFEMTTPEVGRRAFKKYLEDNVKYPSDALNQKMEGRVTIQFTVLSNGQLADFKVIKGIGGGCEEELIRVIKNGPRWKPSKKGDVAIDDQVRVRYRFDLP
jgi:TonB family protein